MRFKKKARIALIGIFAIILIAGSCKHKVDNSGGGTPEKSAEVGLKTFKLNAEDLLPVPADKKIAKIIGNTVETATLIVEAKHEKATVEVKLAGTVIPADSADKTKYNLSGLAKGDNAVTVQVTAENGTKGDLITLTIHRTTDEELEASLIELKIKARDLLPVPYEKRIFTNVNNDEDSVVLTIKPKNEKATVELKFASLVISPTSADKTKFEVSSIGKGDNKLILTVTSPNGEYKNIIELMVHRMTDGEVRELKDTSIEEFKLNRESLLPIPADNKITKNTPHVKDTAVLIVKPTKAKATVEVKLAGTAVPADSADKTKFTLTGLAKGDNNVTVQVTAEDGTKGDLITLIVHRIDDEEFKQDVSLNIFELGTKNLLPVPKDNKVFGSVGNPVEEVVLTIKPANEKATLEVKLAGVAVSADPSDKTKYKLTGLAKGDNVVTVQVTAEDGATKGDEITLTIHRTTDEEFKDVSIDGLPFGLFFNSSFKVDGIVTGWTYDSGTKTFSADIMPHSKYGLLIAIATTNLKASVEMTSPTASFITPTKYDNETKDWASLMFLNDGLNQIDVKVTAEDGATTETYTIELYRDTEIGLNKDTTLSISIDDEPVNVLPDKDDVYNVFLPVPAPASVKLDVKANSPFTIVGINKAVANNKDTETITIGADKVTEVTVNSKANDGTEKAYKVKLTKQASDCSLKNISIKEAPRFKFEALKTVYYDIAVQYGNVNISAIPNDSNATIAIDGKNSGAPDYGKVTISASKLEVDIVVTNGSDSKTYTLNFVEAAPTVDVDVLVVDSIGGTKVDGTVLKVFEAGTTTQVGSDYNVVKGYASVTGLTPNKAYDFELIGQEQKWAGSLVQNYYIDATKKQNLTMIQFVHGDHSRGIEPPKITSIYQVSELNPLKDGDPLDPTISSIFAKFESKVGSIEPVAWHGFGAKLGVGSVPNFQNGIQGSVWLDPIESGGTFTTEYNFNIGGNIILPKGKTDLIIVGYDQANNRVEKHLYIEFDKSIAGKTLEQAKFKNMLMIVQRIPYSAGLYSNDRDHRIEGRTANIDRDVAEIMALDPTADGRRTSYKSVVLFNFEQGGVQEPIIGFDIYRCEKGVGNFKKVSQTLYATAKTETVRGWGIHQGFDTDLGLEENKEYEYKIVAFNESYSKESPVMTVKILESFTYELVGPAKNAELSLEDAKAMSYTCKISNPSLLNKESADFINSGLLIADHQGIMKFGARFNYFFDAKDEDGNYTGKPDLAIFTKLAAGRLSVNKLLALDAAETDPTKKVLEPFGVTKLEDLITLNPLTGELTLTAKFVQIPFFNIIEEGNVSMEYEKGAAYQWDIQDWGRGEYNLNDDLPMRIIKVYYYINDDGEKDYIECQAYGNDSNAGANAINGRFAFTIK